MSIGYVLPSPFYGSISRIEGYAVGDLAQTNQNLSGAIGFRAVDNQSAAAVAGTGNQTPSGVAQQSARMSEIGLRFKADRRWGAWSWAASAEPFYVSFRQSASTSANASAMSFVNYATSLSSDVSARLYGAQLALEGVYPVAERFSVLGRVSAGGYAFDSKGAFSSSLSDFAGVTTAALQTGRSGGGARLGAQLGLRYVAAPGVWISLLGGVDYYSAMPTAELPSQQYDRPAYVGTRRLADYRVGLRVTGATFASPAL